MAPVQVVILPVSDKYTEYAKTVLKTLKDDGIRVKLNDRSDKIGSKIRQAELDKINFMLIVGERETKNRTVSVRKRFEGDHGEVEIASFTKSLKKIINNRSITHRKEANATSE
mgnify:FL=1